VFVTPFPTAMDAPVSTVTLPPTASESFDVELLSLILKVPLVISRLPFRVRSESWVAVAPEVLIIRLL